MRSLNGAVEFFKKESTVTKIAQGPLDTVETGLTRKKVVK